MDKNAIAGTAGEIAGVMDQLKTYRRQLYEQAHGGLTRGFFETRSVEEFGMAEALSDHIACAASVLSADEVGNFREQLNALHRAPTINDVLQVLQGLFEPRRIDGAISHAA